MKSFFTLGVILSFVFSIVKGEPSDSLTTAQKFSSVKILTGLNQIKEMNLLPLKHHGSIKEFSFERENSGTEISMFKFSLSYSRLRTDLEEMSKSGNIRLILKYSRNWLIFRAGDLKYYLGPQASLSYSFMLFPNWDDSHGYWADYFSFGPNNIISIRFKNNQELVNSFNIPVYCLYSRPDRIRLYKMDNSSAGEILNSLNSEIKQGFWNRAFHFNLNSEYRFPIFKSKKEAIVYSLDYTRITKKGDKPLIQLINQVGLKFMF